MELYIGVTIIFGVVWAIVLLAALAVIGYMLIHPSEYADGERHQILQIISLVLVLALFFVFLWPLVFTLVIPGLLVYGVWQVLTARKKWAGWKDFFHSI